MIGTNLSFRDQYERMKRFRNRLNDYSVNQTEYTDNLWAFFQNSYHLKDWIKNDPNLTAIQDVEAYISNNSFIRIAADLANRSKHLKLTKTRGGNADCNKESVTITLPTLQLNSQAEGNLIDKVQGKNQGSCRYFYTIETNGGQSYNHIDIANKIIEEWDYYIQQKGI